MNVYYAGKEHIRAMAPTQVLEVSNKEAQQS